MKDPATTIRPYARLTVPRASKVSSDQAAFEIFLAIDKDAFHIAMHDVSTCHTS